MEHISDIYIYRSLYMALSTPMSSKSLLCLTFVLISGISRQFFLGVMASPDHSTFLSLRAIGAEPPVIK